MSFSQTIKHKAMKQHRCEFCRKAIAAGETYCRVFVADGGQGYSYKSHTFCDDIAHAEHKEASYDDTTLDILMDCARDRVHDAKNNADMAEYYGVTVEQINFVFGEVEV